MVAAAFAGRLKSSSKDDMKPRLLAGLTVAVMNVAIISWFRGEYQDLSTAARQVFAHLARIFFDPTGSTQSRDDDVTALKVARRTSGHTKS